jgi:hypothetical protein
MTRTEIKDYQKQLAAWCCDLHFTHFITLATNQTDFTLNRAEFHLSGINAKIDRYYLGSKWSRFPAAARSLMIAVPEVGHGHANATLEHPLYTRGYSRSGLDGVHYHAFFRPPRQVRRGLTDVQLSDFIRDAWRRYVPSGSVAFSRLLSDEQRQRSASYAMKEFAVNGVGMATFIILPGPGNS